MCTGPNRIAKIGAISITEPKPAKPRIKPATKAVRPARINVPPGSESRNDPCMATLYTYDIVNS